MAKGKAGGGGKKSEGKNTNGCVKRARAGRKGQQGSQGNKCVNKPKKRLASAPETSNKHDSLDNTGSKVRRKSGQDAVDSASVVSVTFEEDGDMVDLEVRGQATEFSSENEEGERLDSEDEEMNDTEQLNNNSIHRKNCDREEGTASQ